MQNNKLIHCNEIFPEVHCINLLERQDRRNETARELTKYNIQYSYFPASGPISTERRRKTGTTLLPGETGAFESHCNLLRMAKEKELPNILILEDDVELAPDFDVKFDKMIRLVPNDWDMIYFGGNHESEPDILGDGLLKCNETFALHMVAIKDTMYDTLLSQCSIFNFAYAVDFIYATTHSYNNVYAFSPALAFQRIDYSDIQGEVVDYTILRRGHNAENKQV